MRISILLLLASAIGLRAQAQTIAPLETVKVHLQCAPRDTGCQEEYHVGPHQEWWTTLPVREETADKKWYASVGGSVLLNIGDVENSLYALNRPQVGGHTVEFNAIFGLHPNRRTYYATTLPVTAFLGWLSWHYKRQSDAEREVGIKEGKYVKWHTPNDLNTVGHAVSIIWTAFATHR